MTPEVARHGAAGYTKSELAKTLDSASLAKIRRKRRKASRLMPASRFLKLLFSSLPLYLLSPPSSSDHPVSSCRRTYTYTSLFRLSYMNVPFAYQSRWRTFFYTFLRVTTQGRSPLLLAVFRSFSRYDAS